MIASPDNDYTYDDLDRLTRSDYHNGENEQFTYDKLGNRESVNMRDGSDVIYDVDTLVNRYDSIGVPIAHWKLDETSGTLAEDSAGSYDGTVNGASHTSSGKFNYALDFDGSDDFVEMDEHTSYFDDLEEGAIALWFKGNDTSGWGQMITSSDSDIGTSQISIGENSDDKLNVRIRENGVFRIDWDSTSTGYFTNGREPAWPVTVIDLGFS